MAFPPIPPTVFWPWVVLGAATQIVATATMLAVMGERSFVVSYAYIKTEAIQAALFGLLILLGDPVTLVHGGLAIVFVATAGVIVISLKGVRPAPRAAALSADASVCSAAPCSLCRRSVIAARFCRSAILILCWRRPSR